MRQIAVISNPYSTRNRVSMPAIRAILDRSKNIFHFEIGSIDDVSEALARFAAIDPLMIVVNGGDGTFQAVLSDLLYHRPFGDWPIPPLAILPSGKTNMIAQDLNCGGRSTDVLDRLLFLADSGLLEDHLARRHLIEMDLGDGHNPRVGMFFGGAGMVGALRYTRDVLHPLGLPDGMTHMLAIWRFVRAVFRGPDAVNSPFRTHPASIRLPDGDTFSGKYAVIVATTLDRLLLGLCPFIKTGRGGLKLTVAEHKPKTILSALWATLRNGIGRKKIEGCHLFRTDRAEITTLDPVTLDGEIYHPAGNAPIVLKGERHLRFVRL